MFSFNPGMLKGLEEQIALAEAAGLIPPSNQPAPQQAPPPVASAPAVQPARGPIGMADIMQGGGQIPQNPYVAPPTPQQPVPPPVQQPTPVQQPAPPPVQQPPPTALVPDVSGPEQLPPGIMTGQTQPQDQAGAGTYVSGTGRYDDDGQTQMQRLALLDEANKELIPEGREPAQQSSYMIQLLYGGLNPGPKATTPDYQAGYSGNTIGGVGNTDAWGNDINWSKPKVGQAELGQTISTPAGDYVVVNGAEGNLALMPLDGAVTNGNSYIYNFTSGKHHVGIDPKTGEVWYQEAAGYTNFEGTQYQNPNAPNNGGGNNGGGNNGGGDNNNPPTNNANPPSNNGSGSSWQEIINRGGKNIESWDRWMGMFTGLDEQIDWSGLDEAGVIAKFDSLPSGLFEGLNRADVLQRLLKNLGLA